MKSLFLNEANKIWNRFTNDAKDKNFTLPLTVHKQLLNLFHVGPFYYYVFDLQTREFALMSEEIQEVLGFAPNEANVPFFLSRIHPEDQPYFLNFENKVADFFSTLMPKQLLNYKVSYDYRIQKADESYTRIFQQMIAIQLDDDNKVIKTLGIHTDISHLKSTGSPVLSFIGLNGEPSYMDVEVKKVFSTSGISISPREREVLALLVAGNNSEQIGAALFISKLTVNTHRKNLLRKAECTNTTALASMAVKKGWL